MLDKDPWMFDPSKYEFVLIIAFMGGVVSYLTGLKNYKFSFFNLFIRVTVGMFVGLVVFFMCESQGIYGPAQAVAISVGSVVNTEAIMLFKCAFRKIFKEKFGVTDTQGDS